MELTTVEMDKIFKAIDEAKMKILAIMPDARMDDILYLTAIVENLDQAAEVLRLSLERRRKMEKDFNKMYYEFESKYNKHPVQMSRAEAFGHALKDNLIDEQTHKESHEYFGSLWYYVGD